MSGPASVRLGTIAGAPVRLSWSWLLIAAVITLAFGPQIQRALPSLGGGAYAVALGYAVLLALSVLVHEAAHALTGRAFGQRTEEIALTLWGGHTQFRSPSARPLDTVLTAMAGPAGNLVLAGLAHLAARAVPGPSVPALLLEVTVWANLLLAAFNALPGTPLDGGRMVESAVWAATGSRARGVEAAGWAGRVVAVGVLAAVLGPRSSRAARRTCSSSSWRPGSPSPCGGARTTPCATGAGAAGWRPCGSSRSRRPPSPCPSTSASPRPWPRRTAAAAPSWPWTGPVGPAACWTSRPRRA
ncbi:M50 family metallopeptidase [Micrococcus luteus]|uniref:M50 family metallopeptidase n=1 Tax=Micrococcus luteus TaxID=1270 RepID=UPI0020CE8A74|nr:site-2 protease family protein [Micrococcus luteus]UTT46699.1 site-2 protease family protein [Micrococcus luteus]